jgi:hypothetical protein
MVGGKIGTTYQQVVAEREQRVQLRTPERCEWFATVAQRGDVGGRQQSHLELTGGQEAGEAPGIGAAGDPGAALRELGREQLGDLLPSG